VEGTDAAQLVKDRYAAGMPIEYVCDPLMVASTAIDIRGCYRRSDRGWTQRPSAHTAIGGDYLIDILPALWFRSAWPVAAAHAFAPPMPAAPARQRCG
jgi:hypothetical protein